MGAPSLAGIGVLVTRPARQADRLAQLIEEAGGRAIRFPVIEIAEPLDNAPLLALIDRLPQFELAIFISPNAVEKAMNLVRARRGVWPAGVAAACVGRGSAKTLRHFGIDCPISPAGRFDSEALLSEPALADVAGKHIVIFRGDGGRELLGNTLRSRGAEVEYAECYRRLRPSVDPTPLLRQWARGEIDIVTITSVEALRNLYDMVGKAGRSWLVRTPIVVLAEAHAQACRELGFRHMPLVAREASDEAILEAIQTWRAA